jgi:hypothetical protein
LTYYFPVSKIFWVRLTQFRVTIFLLPKCMNGERNEMERIGRAKTKEGSGKE